METNDVTAAQRFPAAELGMIEQTERLTLTVDEVAAALGISRSSAYECARRGDIPTVRLGRRLVVPRRAVLALLGEDTTDRRAGWLSADESTRYD